MRKLTAVLTVVFFLGSTLARAEDFFGFWKKDKKAKEVKKEKKEIKKEAKEEAKEEAKALVYKKKPLVIVKKEGEEDEEETAGGGAPPRPELPPPIVERIQPVPQNPNQAVVSPVVRPATGVEAPRNPNVGVPRPVKQPEIPRPPRNPNRRD